MGRGPNTLKPDTKSDLLDYVEKNGLISALLNMSKSPVEKAKAVLKVQDFMKEKKIEKLTEVSEINTYFRKWRHKIQMWKNKKAQSGQGYVKPLDDVDEKFMHLVDGTKGVAHGKKVSFLCIIMSIKELHWGGRDRTRTARSTVFKITLPCPTALSDLQI